MESWKRAMKSEMSKRIKVIYVILVVVALVILGRIVELQFNTTARKHSERIHSRIIDTVPIYAHRGTILDRDRNPLAISIMRNRVEVEFGSERFDKREQFLHDADSLSKLLASFFGDRTPNEYYRTMLAERKKRFRLVNPRQDTIEASFFERHLLGKKDSIFTVWDTKRSYKPLKLFREVDNNEWEALKRMPILKQGANQVHRFDARIYPQGELALRTIGRNDEHSRYGIEYAWREELAGKDGSRQVQVIAPGVLCRVDGTKDVEPVDGLDIVTTLDADVQDVTHKALLEHMQSEQAWWGTSIVMECSTGDILAMVNLGRNSKGEYVENRNYAIGQPMEPGSTFKLVSAMALLEEVGLSTSKRYHTGLGKPVRIAPNIPKSIVDDHKVLVDYKGRPTNGWLDMRTAFAESSNVYFTKAIHEAYIDNPARYEKFIRRLHLDQKMGFERLGEVPSFIPNIMKLGWAPTALVNMAYGYTLQLTPMHTLTLYNAVANNGRMVAPRLIRQTERGGKVVEEFPVRVLDEKICGQTTVDTLRSFMEEVALTGTAEMFFGTKASPFRVGGKTGTAQVAQTIGTRQITYKDRYYLGSMVIYLPADNPKYTILTAICKKRGVGSYYGSTLAGPVQKRIATFLYNRDVDVPQATLQGDEEHYPDHIKGGNIDHMSRVAKEYAAHSKVARGGQWGSCTTTGGTAHIHERTHAAGTMPDVRGMGLTDALFLLETEGLKVEVEGAGGVVQQSIAAGSSIAVGDKVKIVLK